MTEGLINSEEGFFEEEMGKRRLEGLGRLVSLRSERVGVFGLIKNN